MKPHALVLGANGYLGRHIALALVEQGYQVSLAGRATTTSLNLGEYRSIDVRERQSLEPLLATPDYVFVCAGLSGTQVGFERYQDFIDTNEIGLLNILEIVRQRPTPAKIIFLSTRLVYRGASEPLPEAAPKEFKTVYALTKYVGEQYLQMYQAMFGLPYSVFRIGVPYGNRFGTSQSYGTFSHFITPASAGRAITLFGDGQQRRSIIHVEDLAQWLVQATSHPATTGQVFNISGPDALSIREIAAAVAQAYGVEVTHVPWPPLAAMLESGDTVLDETALQEHVPYQYRWRFAAWIAAEKAQRSASSVSIV